MESKICRTNKWTTWYGDNIQVSELSHQHLSNILYYFDLVLDMGDVTPIRTELEKRFGGKQLPYHPMISFRYEIDTLVRKGYTTGKANADIVVNGKWIGKIKYE